MPASFDPYAEWLAIADPERPPNHYRLIGVEPFCDDPDAIGPAADAALLRLRAVAPGAHAEAWQQLVDELSLARLTLTNSLRKLQYDAQLRARKAEAAAQRSAQPAFQAPLLVAAPPIASSRPAATNQPVNLSNDPNLFPPGAAPPMSDPASAQSTNIVAPQSYATPPIQDASLAATSHIPAAPAQPPKPQVSSSMPARGNSSQANSQPAGSVGSFAEVAMPPLVRPQQVNVGEKAKAEVPLFAWHEAPLVNSPSLPPVAEIRPDAANSATALPRHDVEARGEPALMSSDFAPYQKSADISAVPDYLARQSHKSSAGPIIAGTAVAVLVVVGIIIGTARKRPADDESTKIAHNPSTANVPPKQPSLQESRAAATNRPVDSPLESAVETRPAEHIAEPSEPAAGEPQLSTSDKPKAQLRQQPAADPDDMPVDTAATNSKPAIENPSDEDASKTAAPATDVKPEGDPDKAAAFARSSKRARAALGARNLAKAKQEIEAAVAAAHTQPQHDQIERLRLLSGYVDEFWANVGKALKDLQAADEIKIGSTTAAVVDVDETSITLHIAGKNMSYKLADMPAGLVIALADRWFDAKNPSTKVFYGAFHAADAKGDVKEAKRLWEEANLAGAPTADLLPLLDEGSPALVAEQGPVPDARHLAAAEKTFKAAYQQELRSAKTSLRKLELAKKFVDVAMTTEDAAERYVLFLEGYKIASEEGNPLGIVRAVDEMAKWYEVDALELKSTALVKAGAATSNSLVAKAVVRSELELIDLALADKRLEHAGKLSQAAMSAAKKTKDAALVKQAAERAQQVRELTKETPDGSAGE